MKLAIVILLIPITYIVGGLYSLWLWRMLPPDLQIATYTEGMLNFLMPVVTVLAAMVSFGLFKNMLLPTLHSELLLLLMLWIVAVILLMNPFVVGSINSGLCYVTNCTPLP